jgi:feruloyl esterase
MARADEKAGSLLNASSPDLSAARNLGAKFIFYQGWDDEVLQAENTPNYYQQVMGAMGGQASTQGFARLFMVPGMAHCYFGPGASSFGGVGQQIPPVRDAQHDLQKALERWVEDGVAPASMVATKYADDLPGTRRIVMQRTLCPYPSVARYKGIGNVNEASSFSCVAP